MTAPLTADAAAQELADRAVARIHAAGAAVVAVAGPVAVGKSTFAALLADALVRDGRRAEAVSTDGFLFTDAELAARGLMDRKGFPESYDVEKLWAFLAAARAGVEHLPVPEYSHESYDVLPGVTRTLGRVDVLVLEGVNALYATVGRVDLGVYVHADDGVVETWFLERFRRYCADPAPGSFYARFAGLDPAAVEDLARHTWEAINLPNLRDHIGPSRQYADVVVEKTPDHGVGAIVEVTR